MDRDRFYQLIRSAREDADDGAVSVDPLSLRSVLEALDDQEVTGFAVAFREELILLNRWDIWGAGYLANGGLSDDGFHYFRSWLIGKGRAAVDAVLADPDSLADLFDDEELEQTGLENEELEYAAIDELEERDQPDPRDRVEGPGPDGEPAGEPFDEDTVDARYPRIAAVIG